MVAFEIRRRRVIDDAQSYIDGSYVPAKNGGDCVGRCRAGRATKIMALADSAGLPISVTIADGSRHDVRARSEITQSLRSPIHPGWLRFSGSKYLEYYFALVPCQPSASTTSVDRLVPDRALTLVDQTLDEAVTHELPARMIGDRAFDSVQLSDRLHGERNIELIAPKRKTSHRRVQDGRAMRRYKRRWKVERLFGWLKRFRRITARWERSADNYLGFVQLAAAVVILRHF